LLGERPGDNRQCLALVEALGRPYAVKRLVYNRLYRVWNPLLGARLLSLDRGRSDPLTPPWPDLVVAVGRRSVPIARWIRAQSGGRTRLVQIGRPRAPLGGFDLVVTTPQYGLPERPNVVRLALPMIGAARLDAAARARWERRLAEYRRPWVGVLVGGRADPYDLDPATAALLGRRATALAAGLGGSLLVVTGPRTSGAAAEALGRSLAQPVFFHRWRPDDPDNPYPAILGLADRFVVTADSVSMVTEAISARRPVHLFLPPQRPSLGYRLMAGLRLRAWPLYRWLCAGGLIAGVRDTPALMAALRRERLVLDMDDAGPASPIEAPGTTAVVAGRVAAMLAEADPDG
jgi:mitochondrial fission protein ELM1